MFSIIRSPLATSARAFSTSAKSSDLAKMILIGRIGAEPVMKQTKNGKDFLIYKVATSDSPLPAKDGEALPERTTSWHTIFAYGPACERLSALEKGSLVHVEATFQVVNEKTEAGEFKTSVFARHERLTMIRRPTASTEEESA